jgi:hypothetical protein
MALMFHQKLTSDSKYKYLSMCKFCGFWLKPFRFIVNTNEEENTERRERERDEECKL